MKNTQTFKLLMLPCKNNTQIFLEDDNTLEYYKIEQRQGVPAKGHHLYIISDEEIKIDDWITDHKRIAQVNCLTINDPNRELFQHKKIIATTNKALDIPLIPYSFVPPFIKAWNDNKKITEVNLEMELFYIQQQDSEVDIELYKVKTREDHTVIILESKKYSKEEVKMLIMNAMVQMSDWKNEGKITQELNVLIDKYIENKLK